jgi:alpha-D-ribose 1-methylphosphonate 5-triphosphate synthase subunit PhnL
MLASNVIGCKAGPAELERLAIARGHERNAKVLLIDRERRGLDRQLADVVVEVADHVDGELRFAGRKKRYTAW